MERSKVLLPGLVLLLGMFAGAPVFGQSDGAEGGGHESEAAADGWSFEGTGWGRFVFSSELKAGGTGDFSVRRSGAKVRLNRMVFDDSQVSVGAIYEFNQFDFNGPNSIFAGTNDPFSDVQRFSLGAGFFDRIDERWSWGAGVRGEYFGESGVSFSEASTLIGTGLARYQANADLVFGIGLLVRSEIEDDTLVVPVLTLDWQLDDAWKLTVGEAEGFPNPRVLLSYDFGDDAVFGLGLEYVRDRFRLDDDAIRRGSVIEDSSLPIMVSFTFKPAERATVYLEGGLVMFQEFEVVDKFGGNGREFDSEATFFLGASLSWNF